MYLKAIELHGFKSFPDKTRITFDKGMTAVIGPNGSGKSNISDAIRWVLGETSGKELRATGKMEDIIFGGTSIRGPMGFASVSLVLDNSDRSFDMDTDEVVVTRKYYRGGDGEYFINSNRVRLKDIYELFLDTGLGKSGYSIVGQGKISQIVTSKPENRREIFEEASGISKFRYKKNEAEKKLNSAQDNIVRLSDILLGLEERVGPLEKESKKAKEFIELSEKKKGMEISLWLSTVDKNKALIREQQRKMEIFQFDFDTVEKNIKEKEDYIEKRYFESNALIQKGESNQTNIRNTEQTIADKNSEKAVLESQEQYDNQKIEELNNELIFFTQSQEQSENQKKSIIDNIEIKKAEKEEFFEKQQQLEEDIEAITENVKMSDSQKGNLVENENQLKAKIQDSRMNLVGIQTQNQSVMQTSEKAHKDIETTNTYLESVNSQIVELKSFIFDADENITRNTNIKNGIGIRLDAVKENLKKAGFDHNQNIAKQHDTQNRIRLLTDMENNLEGFQHSVKNVLNMGRKGALKGVEGTVAQLINVKKGYETAVEIALGYALQNIIVENETCAKHAIEYLKNNKAGRATFLPLDTVKPSTFNEKLPEWATTADKVITADSRYNNIISNLLARTIITEDINSASRLAKQLNYRFKIVTMDGQQINAGGSFTGGSMNKSAGLFSRKGEIEKLKEQLVQLKTEEEKLLQESEKIKENADLLQSQIEGCNADIETIQIDKNNCNIELAKFTQQAEQYENSIDMYENIIKNAENVLKSNAEREKVFNNTIKECEENLAKVREELAGLGKVDENSQEKQNQLNAQLQQIKLDIVRVTGEISLLENNLEQLLTQSQNSQEKKQKILDDIEEIKSRIENRKNNIQEIIQSVLQLKDRIKNMEEENKDFIKLRFEIEQERTQINNDVKALTEQKIELSNQITKIGEKIVNMETVYDDIIQKLWEEYELTVQTASEFAFEYDDENQIRKDLSFVKASIKRLGNVNVGAIEEYKEVSEKYNFLKDQLKDLEDSKQQLSKLIASLNGEMKAMFAESFYFINKNFDRIFSELFGGGSAQLILTDPENILESGVDIQVSPPGKVIKNLTALSGGEQSLVAISIYFAILAHNPSPFCVLDEIEAALDDANVTRYANYIHNISDSTQFIVITHRRGTMESADVLYGVTMQDDGISKLLKLDVNNISPSLIN